MSDLKRRRAAKLLEISKRKLHAIHSIYGNELTPMIEDHVNALRHKARVYHAMALGGRGVASVLSQALSYGKRKGGTKRLKKFLDEEGSQRVKEITIERSPILPVYEGVMNKLSRGGWSKVKVIRKISVMVARFCIERWRCRFDPYVFPHFFSLEEARIR